MQHCQSMGEDLSRGNDIYTGRIPANDYLKSSVRTRGRDINGTSTPVVHIPASLVVTAAAFREFMRKNRLDEVVEGLLSGVNVKHIDELLQPASQIREIIRSSPLPKQLLEGILEGCREMGDGTTVVWPVTVPLELFYSTKKYQQFPYLQASGPEETIEAIRTWWASLFESAAIFFRELNGQRHRDAVITVAAHRKPDPGHNGRNRDHYYSERFIDDTELMGSRVTLPMSSMSPIDCSH